MKVESFNNEIDFNETHIKTKVLIETSFSKEIRILLMKDQIMKEHKTPFPILIHLLEGEIALGINGNTHLLKAGNIIALDGNVPHDLNARENSVVRLTLSKHDKVERVNEVLNS